MANETDAVTMIVYKWVLIGVDTESGLGFAYLTVDANAQSTKEELDTEDNYNSLGWLTMTEEYTAHSVQPMGREMSSSEY